MTAPRPPATAAELFDVVDARDRVIGQAPRGEVHAQNLLHRAVHVMIHDAAGRVFLQRRSLAKDTFPGCWDTSCSGHVDAGEDYPTAARRELREELGLADPAPPPRPFIKLEAGPATGHEFIQIYLLGPCAGPFTLHPEEISEGRWIEPAALNREITANPLAWAGSLRHLWTHHREPLLTAIRANLPPA